jgi:6-pyruvoyltetrahydropterin/6-carboxytetrahydropterin synthase
MHLEDVERAMEDAREALDHRLLNEVDGLDVPTLERITMWLWDRLHNKLPGLAEIEEARDSCHEGCVYRGPRLRLAAE